MFSHSKKVPSAKFQVPSENLALFPWHFALQKWDEFWTKEVPPHALAIFRVAFGFWMFFYWLGFAPYITLMLSQHGTAVALFPEYPIPGSGLAFVLYIVLMLSLLGIALGAFFRIAAPVAFLIAVHHWFVSLHHFGTSFDLLYLFLLLTMVLSRADATYSLHMLRKKGSIFAWEPVSVFAQRLIQVQIFATYFGVGWQKVWLPDWKTGEILSWSFAGLWGTPFALWFVQKVRWLLFYDVLNFTVKCFEVFLPIGLWWKPAQKWTFIGGIFFHVTLVLFLGMWWFLPMIVTYLLFLDPIAVKDKVTSY